MGAQGVRRARLSSGAAFVSGMLVATAAQATDWSLTSGFSQRFSADSNITVEPESEGGVFGSVTDLGLTLNAEQKVSRFFISPGVAFRQFIGPGDDGDLDSIDPRVALGFTHQTKRNTFNGDAFFRAAQTSFSQVDDTGTTDVDARQFNFGGSLGATREIDPRNNVSLTGSASIIEFSESSTEFDPSRRFSITPGWQRQFSETISGGASFSASYFRADSVEDPETFSIAPRVNLNVDVNRRLTLGGSGGFSVSNTERTEGGVRSSETNIGGIGSFDLSYAAGATTVGLGLEQSLDANSEGELDNLTAVTFEVGHDVNSDLAIGFSSTLSRRDTLGAFDGSSDEPVIFFSVGPSVSYQVTRDWTAQLGYNLRVVDDFDGTGVSNGVFFSVARTFTLLP